MFTKTPTKPEARAADPAQLGSAAAAPAGRRLAAKPVSLLASDLSFEGTISGDGELVIEGAARGEFAVARLSIGEQARVEGSLKAGAIDIRGRFVGTVVGSTVRLYQTAHVEGDITHDQLSIEAGAFFEGRCQQAKPRNEAADAGLAALAAPAVQDGGEVVAFSPAGVG